MQADSTGPSSRPEHSAGHRYVRLIVATLLVALLAEGAVRAIANQLPEPLEWHSYETQLKVERMDEIADAGGLGVVFLGSSMMNSAVDPAVLARATGGKVIAYNAALGAGTPQISVPWAEHVVFPRLDPDVVVIGVASIDVTRRDRDLYNFFAGSQEARLALDKASLLDRAEDFLEEHVALVRYRAGLRDPAILWDALRGRETNQVPRDAAVIHRTGFQPFLSAERFETRKPGPRRALASLLPDFEIAGLDRMLLERFVVRTEAAGRQVVLVKLPVTEEYIALHPNGPSDYAAFEAEVARIAAKAGADVIDLGGIRDHQFFADEHHLNGRGTERATTELAAALADIVAKSKRRQRPR